MPLPTPAARFEDESFWTGGEHGELRVTRCRTCRRWQHPPTPTCRGCGSDEIGPETASGRASVFSFTINHQPWASELDVPYVLAIVSLVEDPTVHLTTRLVDVEPCDVRIGMAVAVRFEQLGAAWLPLFAPVGQS